MKKVLYVITQTHYGGAAKYVHDLALGLSKHNDFEPIVAVGEGIHEPWMDELTEAGIHVIRLKHVKRNLSPWHDFLSGFELLKLYKKVQPDVIHLNSSKVGATGSVAAGIYGKAKVIYTVHGLVLNEPLSLFHKSFYWFAEWFGGLFKDVLIAVSEYDKKAVMHYGIAAEKKVHVVYNGINLDPAQFLDRAQAREELGLDDRFTIGTVAGLYSTKGHKYALRAINSLSQEEKDALHYIIIGRGPEQKNLEQFIRKNNLNESVTLLGTKDNAAQYLKAFDVFMLPSVKEGLSYTLIEARAAELPIIATNVGGNPEVIEHEKTGLLVPSQDPESLAGAIKHLADDEALRTSLAQNAAQNLDHFSVGTMVAETIKHY